MTDDTSAEEPPDWLIKSEPCQPSLHPRDYIYSLDLDFDVASQFEAIHGLLRRNLAAADSLAKEIHAAEENARRLSGIRNEIAVDEHISLLNASVYQDAAQSMAAIGMLAPLLETVFTQCFRGIGAKLRSATPKDPHERWHAAHDIQWDCHFVIAKGSVRKDVVSGILQLSDAIGLRRQLPADLHKVLAAVFGYRNKMFHLGFEWPKEDRKAFQRRIIKERWPSTWFRASTVGDDPWIFYMTETFIEHCLATADDVLIAFGDWVRLELLKRKNRNEG